MNPSAFGSRLDACLRRFESEPLTDVMDECYVQAMEGERYMFQTGTAPDGEVWPRRVGKATHPLLNLSGQLAAAAQGGPGSVREIGYRELRWGVKKTASGSLAGALVHQYGATIYPKVKKYLSFVIDGIRVFARKVTIPARPYIGLPLEFKENCREIIGQGVHEKVFQR